MLTYWEMTMWIIHKNKAEAGIDRPHWKAYSRITLVFLSYFLLPSVIGMIYNKEKYGREP
jgi:hypothetical protein